MRCGELERFWEDWLSGNAPAEVDQHLKSCPRCCALANGLTQTSRWLALLRQEPPEPSAAFWARLRQRLEETERHADFWTALTVAAGRAAVALAVLVLLLTVWIMRQPSEPAVAEFDTPQIYLEETAGLPVGSQQLTRDGVVLTLVAQTEPQR